jgi:hypothetical protein
MLLIYPVFIEKKNATIDMSKLWTRLDLFVLISYEFVALEKSF